MCKVTIKYSLTVDNFHTTVQHYEHIQMSTDL